jgi:desulfoferrodoxin (superoxide reductase-like protein)
MTNNKYIHWIRIYKHPDDREIKCEGGYKKGVFDFSKSDCDLKMSKSGFKLISDNQSFRI